MQDGRQVETAGTRGSNQFIIRNTAPEEEREARRELEIADAIDRSGHCVDWIPLDAERELCAGEETLQRQLHAALEVASPATRLIERHQPCDVVRGLLAAKRQPC